MLRAAVAAALLASAALAYAPTPLIPAASAATWTVSTATRSDAEVRAKWQQLMPVYSGSPYTAAPSVKAPYAPGELAAGFRADGLNMINFGRYLAGLPADVTTDPAKNSNAQYGAVLLSASSFSHAPAKPADMDSGFYSVALAATSSSNIGGGYSTSWSFQKGCLDDGDAGNIDRVGHRRWLLNPRMLSTGIGFAEYFHTTYAVDSSRPSDQIDYDYIAWPSAGPFPVEFVNTGTPWSITLNPAKYDFDATRTGHTVTVRRVADGRTWIMDASDTTTGGEYFNANFGGYGVANAFIFRPDPTSAVYKPGDQFDVTLSGGIFAKGTRTPVVVTFRTRFMSLDGPADPGPTPNPQPDPIPDPGAAGGTRMPVYRFYNTRNGSHFYTASATEKDTVIARLSATYNFEGVAYTVDTASPANSASLFRFYNTANGSHFYTASVAERDHVIAALPGTYLYEGPAYSVSLSPVGTSPVYRFYNTRNGSHFYTTSATERDSIVASLGATYSYEGPAFYLAQ